MQEKGYFIGDHFIQVLAHIDKHARQGIARDIKRNDIVPALMRAWNHAMTKENVRSGFLRTGIYPFDPLAYKATRKDTTISVTGFPLIITPTIRLLEESSALSSIVQCLLLNVSSPSKPNACPACGQTPKKQKPKRTLSTRQGVLLTGAQARAEMKEIEEKKEREEGGEEEEEGGGGGGEAGAQEAKGSEGCRS